MLDQPSVTSSMGGSAKAQLIHFLHKKAPEVLEHLGLPARGGKVPYRQFTAALRHSGVHSSFMLTEVIDNCLVGNRDVDVGLFFRVVDQASVLLNRKSSHFTGRSSCHAAPKESASIIASQHALKLKSKERSVPIVFDAWVRCVYKQQVVQRTKLHGAANLTLALRYLRTGRARDALTRWFLQARAASLAIHAGSQLDEETRTLKETCRQRELKWQHAAGIWASELSEARAGRRKAEDAAKAMATACLCKAIARAPRRYLQSGWLALRCKLVDEVGSVPFNIQVGASKLACALSKVQYRLLLVASSRLTLTAVTSFVKERAKRSAMRKIASIRRASQQKSTHGDDLKDEVDDLHVTCVGAGTETHKIPSEDFSTCACGVLNPSCVQDQTPISNAMPGDELRDGRTLSRGSTGDNGADGYQKNPSKDCSRDLLQHSEILRAWYESSEKVTSNQCSKAVVRSTNEIFNACNALSQVSTSTPLSCASFPSHNVCNLTSQASTSTPSSCASFPSSMSLKTTPTPSACFPSQASVPASSNTIPTETCFSLGSASSTASPSMSPSVISATPDAPLPEAIPMPSSATQKHFSRTQQFDERDLADKECPHSTAFQPRNATTSGIHLSASSILNADFDVPACRSRVLPAGQTSSIACDHTGNAPERDPLGLLLKPRPVMWNESWQCTPDLNTLDTMWHTPREVRSPATVDNPISRSRSLDRACKASSQTSLERRFRVSSDSRSVPKNNLATAEPQVASRIQRAKSTCVLSEPENRSNSLSRTVSRFVQQDYQLQKPPVVSGHSSLGEIYSYEHDAESCDGCDPTKLNKRADAAGCSVIQPHIPLIQPLAIHDMHVVGDPPSLPTGKRCSHVGDRRIQHLSERDTMCSQLGAASRQSLGDITNQVPMANLFASDPAPRGPPSRPERKAPNV
eukprot:gnl/MRDRNA2_/MRDRNA2_74385_c0_seq2.p1 gnl/MRDRNA2_/MRDRNA2_74385_c0~~gnl/MRDRNA2_/MRDRNA2_74385_c0_seq2.p1  ORF type:complete len:921 (-),score=147.77 gnl/MRDRNA2_/MRDRNA2_74385_c0_seq2:196-2958(-)